MRVLMTGGAGFIGHHVAEHILRNTDWHLTLLDRIDTSSNLNRLTQIATWEQHKHRVQFVFHDLRAPINDHLAKQLGQHRTILHLAAMTHVDRSIADPLDAVYNNVVGTAHILEHARRGCERFLYFSTDEVFGPAPEKIWYREWDRYRSTNPYSATKAGGEELTLAYNNTYKVPTLITHTMNVFGERQHPEKFIPLCIARILEGESVPIHASPNKQPGSRTYIHARNVAAALMHVLSYGLPSQKYNIVGEREMDNLRLALEIARIIGKPLHYDLVDFHSSRPGHDLRYALDGGLLADMGWTPPVDFETSLTRVVQWYRAHPDWLHFLTRGYAA